MPDAPRDFPGPGVTQIAATRGRDRLGRKKRSELHGWAGHLPGEIDRQADLSMSAPDGKVAIVAGAGSGIAYATAKLFACE